MSISSRDFIVNIRKTTNDKINSIHHTIVNIREDALLTDEDVACIRKTNVRNQEDIMSMLFLVISSKLSFKSFVSLLTFRRG